MPGRSLARRGLGRGAAVGVLLGFLFLAGWGGLRLFSRPTSRGASLTPLGEGFSGPGSSPAPGEPVYTTFSIAGLDPETGEIGVAVSSRVPCVGTVVPHVWAGVGAVVTQAAARVEFAEEIFRLLQEGKSPSEALAERLASDPRSEDRQIAVLAADGRSAQHTGKNNLATAGHRSGRGYVVQGNLLVSGEVLRAMARSFEATRESGRSLAERLLLALEAGQDAGGDARRGLAHSAALQVADPRPGRSTLPRGLVLDLDVCEHEEPIVELRRMYESVTETLGFRTLQQFHGADVFQLKLLLHALGYFRPGGGEPRLDHTAYFFDEEIIQAVDRYREDRGLSNAYLGSPRGLVDRETVRMIWDDLERRGMAEALRRRIRELLGPR